MSTSGNRLTATLQACGHGQIHRIAMLREIARCDGLTVVTATSAAPPVGQLLLFGGRETLMECVTPGTELDEMSLDDTAVATSLTQQTALHEVTHGVLVNAFTEAEMFIDWPRRLACFDSFEDA